MNNIQIKNLAEEINKASTTELKTAMKGKFNIDITTNINIENGQISTTRVDGIPFTKEEYTFIVGFLNGYSSAIQKVIRKTWEGKKK